MLGLWLFISAFLWPRTGAQRTNALICGVLAVVFALSATRSSQLRYLNTGLGVWLFISTFVLSTFSAATMWNHVIVGVLLFLISLLHGGRAHGGVATPPRATAV